MDNVLVVKNNNSLYNGKNLLDNSKNATNDPKCCCGGCSDCKNIDIVFVYDVTGSMSNFFSSVSATIEAIVRQVKTDSGCRFGLVTYSDYTTFPGGSNPSGPFWDEPWWDGWEIVSPLTNDYDAFLATLPGVETGAGVDTPEQQMDTLYQVANGWESSLNGDASRQCRAIIWMGDNPGWEGYHPAVPALYHIETNYKFILDVYNAMIASNIIVTAVDFENLDDSAHSSSLGQYSSNQASRLVNATGGNLANSVIGGDSDELEEAICDLFGAIQARCDSEEELPPFEEELPP
jgi:hypothetical protein